MSDFGTPAGHCFRTTDPFTSVEAAFSVDTTKLEKMVYEAILSFGEMGCIGDDVHKKLSPIGIQTLSPRYRPLIEKKMIEETGEKRKGASGRKQRVLRACNKDFAPVSASAKIKRISREKVKRAYDWLKLGNPVKASEILKLELGEEDEQA
jgi:hypothetical protein